ncbi:hypothetical protein TNCV_3169961 [Trichonephila clavipes]|nr:hypothetical protein TNCV_3169961 [Trichonephila clavipes]
MHLNEWYTVLSGTGQYKEGASTKVFSEEDMMNHVSQFSECMSSTASSIEKSSDTLSELRALKSPRKVKWLPSSLLAQTIDRLFLRQ